jgi:hypothetical protein
MALVELLPKSGAGDFRRSVAAAIRGGGDPWRRCGKS